MSMRLASTDGASPVLARFMTASEDAEGRPKPRPHVDETTRRPHGVVAPWPVTLISRVNAWEEGGRAWEGVMDRLAEGADGAVDEARVGRPQSVGAEAQPLGRSGLQGMDEDVSSGREVAHNRPALLQREVDRHAALVAVEGEEGGRLARHLRRSPVARVVAPSGALDLDDVGAEIGRRICVQNGPATFCVEVDHPHRRSEPSLEPRHPPTAGAAVPRPWQPQATRAFS